jgi:heptosyltransferase-2
MKTKILIIQTAFIGDVILTLPVAQVLKNETECIIDFLCIPDVADLVKKSKYIDNVIIYDKKNHDKGIRKLYRLSRRIRFSGYDLIISPHRSARSAFLAWRGKSTQSISFDKSALSLLYNDKVTYIKNIHEIQRNLKLLEPTGIKVDTIVRPEIFIHESDEKVINLLFKKFGISNENKPVTIAPGSVWMTKRYPPEKFVKLLDILSVKDIYFILAGGKSDVEICKYITDETNNRNVFSSAGKLTLTQSAELIRRSSVLITNDSAPLHLANAVGTKVIAIFGATVPEFGFFPYGKNDVIFQINGLKCRPCSIHGLNKCPVKTLDCLKKIKEEDIAEEILKSISSFPQEPS